MIITELAIEMQAKEGFYGRVDDRLVMLGIWGVDEKTGFEYCTVRNESGQNRIY